VCPKSECLVVKGSEALRLIDTVAQQSRLTSGE
jgi:hypothetical protein